MAIDMTKINQKFDALNGKGNSGGSQNVFWKPQEGDQDIRIVCPEDGDPFKQFYFHYNVGKNPGFICPKKQHGKDCPICNFAWHTYNEAKKTNDTEALKLAKSLFPKERFFSPVVIRGEENQGVRLWGYGKMAYTELLSLVRNPDYGDITDVDGGTDLTLNYGKPPGAAFPVTKLQPRRRPSALSDDDAQAAEFLNGIPSFTDNFNHKSNEEIEQMLSEFLSGGSSSESETTKYNNTEASDVDAAFKELLS